MVLPTITSFQWKVSRIMNFKKRIPLALMGMPIMVMLMIGILCANPIEAVEPSLKTEKFDQDPGWDSYNNRIEPDHVATVAQDFGYSRTNHAGQARGEIGGQLWRSPTPAFYADHIATKTLDDKLTASGTYVVIKTDGGSGVFFGWFNANQPGGGRPPNSLGWYLDGERSGTWLLFLVLTGKNKSHGAFVNEFRGPRIPNDGSRHTWEIVYDPQANQNNGAISFVWDGGEPVISDLPPHIKAEGAILNRFGMMNIQKSGGGFHIYVDDLQYDGKQEDFEQDPQWTTQGNRRTYQETEVTGAHQFGFSQTDFAGSSRGEMGGIFWRAEEPYGYYGDPVGPLTLEDSLFASGRMSFKVGAPDSAMHFGWFNSASRHESGPLSINKPPRQFVGATIEGPSRIGHYFRPSYATPMGWRLDVGPVLYPSDKKHSWSMSYDPKAADGKGAITVTLDDQSATLNLEPGQKTAGAVFDRFGVFTSRSGGSQIKAYFDDLQYTAVVAEAERTHKK
jgi:hypothetical protein